MDVQAMVGSSELDGLLVLELPPSTLSRTEAELIPIQFELYMRQVECCLRGIRRGASRHRRWGQGGNVIRSGQLGEE